jgi:enterochelin esterase-like enzyme/sugar lactone lactonase YvrE
MYRLLAAALFSVIILQADNYAFGPDSQLQPGVPQGTVKKFTWNQSALYAGTTRDYWVYIPAQYDTSKPACVMVFQDGAGFVKPDGPWRVPIVLDNLIAQKAIPITIGVFIDPGVYPSTTPKQQDHFNRSYEYDALGDRYARFVLNEILPEVSKTYNLSPNPDDRAIAGSSSGAIAAFTVAWEHPEAFHRVLSFIGSYTNLRGGDAYIDLVRKMEPKPLRIFMQDGSNDVDIYAGSWFMANQALAKSLAYAGYDSKLEIGTEGHNAKHGGAILPDALRWLWRDYPKPIVPAIGGKEDRHFITEILDPGQDWQAAGQGYDYAEGAATDPQGNVYFCDSALSRIYKISAVDGQITLFKEGMGGTTGLTFSNSGILYTAEAGRRRVAGYLPGGQLTIRSTNLQANDVAVSTAGNIYFSESPRGRVWMIDSANERRVVFDASKDGNVGLPYCVRVLPDDSGLVLTDQDSRASWAFRFANDGTLLAGEPFFHLEMPDQVARGPLRSGARGVTFDDQGYSYFATKLGVQICDQPGRVVGIIRVPGSEELTDLAFGGPDMQTLYVTAVGKVYKRHLRRKGIRPGQVLSLPKPQL